jgi:hypothetical protein
MALRESEREPTSVVGGCGVTRLVRSPAAIFPAVDSMERRGRSARRTRTRPVQPPMRTMIEPATAKYEAVVRRVCCMSDRGRAIVMYPENSPESCSYTGTTRARHPRPTFDEETVIGSVWNEEMGAEEVSTRSGRLGLPDTLRVSSE